MIVSNHEGKNKNIKLITEIATTVSSKPQISIYIIESPDNFQRKTRAIYKESLGIRRCCAVVKIK